MGKGRGELEIPADALVFIRKEANNIEDQPLDVIGTQVFINEEDIKQKILNLCPKEVGIRDKVQDHFKK